MATIRADIAAIVFTATEKARALARGQNIEALRARALLAFDEATNPLLTLDAIMESGNKAVVDFALASMRTATLNSPVVNFTFDPAAGSTPLPVAFLDASTNAPSTWAWEKNDGGGWVPFAGTPTVQNPTETFVTGTWDVRLTATNESGSGSSTMNNIIVVSA